MNFKLGSPRTLAIMALTVVLAGATIVFARPRPVSNAALGAGWACSRTAFVLTTCAPTSRQPVPAAETSSKDPSAIRRAYDAAEWN